MIKSILKVKTFLFLLFQTVLFQSYAAPLVTASAEYLPWGGAAVNAFDGNKNTCWVITNPNTGWLKIQYDSPVCYNIYQLVGTPEIDLANINRNPAIFNFEGSTDGTAWTTIDSKKDITWSKPSEVKTFITDNIKSFTYYRLNIISNQGNSHTQFAELTLSYATPDYEAPSVPKGLINSVPKVNGFLLTWNQSTDNVEVTEYEIYRDGVLYGTTSGTSLPIVCLPSKTYSLTVRALDFYRNTSSASVPLLVSTPILIPGNIYVAKTGSDVAGNGSIDQPYKTIQKASDKAALGDIIQVRAGIYREAVDIKEDLITLKPYSGETVILSGTDFLSDWKLASGNTYQTNMNWDVDAAYGTNQLFADGKMLELTRWPDQTSTDIVMPTNALADGATASGNFVTLTDADFDEPDGRWVGATIWVNLSRNGVDGMGWTGVVTSTSAWAHTITVDFRDTPRLKDEPWGIGKNTEYFLFNPTNLGVSGTGGVNALLSNGEWWKNGNFVYVKTFDGTAPGTIENGSNVIEAKKRHFGFYSSGNHFGYTIKDFVLFGCAITTDNAPYANRDNILEAAHDILIEGITATYVSHQTNMTGNWQGQHYNWTGFIVSGRNNCIRNCNIQYSATSALSVSGYGAKVLNNTIFNTNYMCSNSGAFNTGNICLDAEIANNTIFNTTVMAINMHGFENSNINVPDVARIHNNTIYNFMRRSGDSGAIDVAGKDFQWARIDHNTIFNDTPVTGTMVHGIYLDFGGGPGIDITRCTVDHNLIYDVPQPILVSSTRFVNVFNNTLMSNGTIGSVINANGGTKGIDVKIYNNIMNNEPNIVGNYDYNLSKADIKNNLTNASGLYLNSLFSNASGHDFHLISTAKDAIDKGISVGVYDENVIGLPDLGAFEFGGSNDTIEPTVPSQLDANGITDVGFMLKWEKSTDNIAVANYEIYKDGVFYGFSVTDSLMIRGLLPSVDYTLKVKSRDTSGNTSPLSEGLIVTTLSDTEIPTAPTALTSSIPGTAFVLSWNAATDNIGIASYDVYKDGYLYGTTYKTSLFITCYPSTANSMTVIAKDLAGNSSVESVPLLVSTALEGLFAYEGFDQSVNSGTGWGGNWSRTPAVSKSGLSFGGLEIIGDKFGGTSINMTRPLFLGIPDGESLYLSYICKENASDLSFILTSASGGISLRNGRFEDNTAGAVQENSYMSSNLGGSFDGNFKTSPSVKSITSFNLVEIRRTNNEFQLNRWVYTDSSKLPSSMPVSGDTNAFLSSHYKSNDLGFLEITGINLLCKNGTESAYYDEIRFGGNFSDVVPQVTNSITLISDDEIRIYTIESKIVADLSDLRGSSVITVFNVLGSVIKSVKSNGNEKVIIDPRKQGVYLISVINGNRQHTKKLAIF